MKIILIPPAETNYVWEPRCDSRGFDAALAAERSADIGPLSPVKSAAGGYKLFVAASPAAAQTADALFTYEDAPVPSPLLDEVPLRSFRDTTKKRPLWLWKLAARFQWRIGAKRQPETRAASIQRAKQALQLAESAGADCVLITPPLFLRTLAGELERAGYCVEGLGAFGGVKPLERVRATKKDTHCGGCIHNCLLTNPGCGIGLTKAKDQGIAARR